MIQERFNELEPYLRGIKVADKYTIIESILKNNYIDLTKFNLDIVQEATIQHELLYKHNLNLKTWQLEKFMDSKQLHSLLEPNIYHKLNTSV